MSTPTPPPNFLFFQCSTDTFISQLSAVLEKGTKVYQERSSLAVCFYWGVILYCFYMMLSSPAYIALSILIMMVHVDLYGAVLHVVLDHAPFCALPVIDAGCLEFQWHHAIPRDIVSKPYLQVVSEWVCCGRALRAKERASPTPPHPTPFSLLLLQISVVI